MQFNNKIKSRKTILKVKAYDIQYYGKNLINVSKFSVQYNTK